MNLARKIYEYINLYHEDSIKCILTIENWQRKDWDGKYPDYLNSYFSHVKDSKNELDKQLENLKKDKDKFIEIIIKFVKYDFLKKHDYYVSNLSEDEKLKFKSRLDTIINKHLSNNTIEPAFIKEIRNFENEIYRGG